MIISQIIGGLGNQMFQYAAGRSLSLQKGQTFKLDISSFTDYGLHQGFELERVFNCKGDLAHSGDIKAVLGWQASPYFRRVLARKGLEFMRRKAWMVEPSLSYWPQLTEVSKDCYLTGYWQSEKYFTANADQIRSDFTFHTNLSVLNQEIADQISNRNAVSIHIRRGDYIKNKTNLAIYGSCSIHYYRNAIGYIAEQIPDPYFVIFSDDIEWVREKLDMPFAVRYVDHNRGSESFNDMRLMSLCKHHIIANSTFSWWGAWLGSHSSKIVIAPKPWFDSKNLDTQDIIPQHWHTFPKSNKQ